MKLNKILPRRLPTFVATTITLLVIISTLAVSGTLYYSLVKSLEHEFEERIEAESGEVGQALSNRLSRIGTRLRALSLDNTVRVTLMLGAHKQLEEYLHGVYTGDPDLHFVVTDETQEKFFTPSAKTLGKQAYASAFQGLPAALSMNNNLAGEMFAISCYLPISRQNDRIGFAAAVYHAQYDSFLKSVLAARGDGMLVLVHDDKVWDLLSGQPAEIDVSSQGQQFIGETMQYLSDGKNVAVSLNQLPGLYFVSSLERLENAKHQVLQGVALPALAIAIMAIVVSRYLSHRLVRPLQQLSGVARKISEGEQDISVDVGRAYLVEVDQLQHSLRTMVNYLQQAREKERYKELFEGVADMVFIHALDGGFVEVNDVALRRLGIEREQLQQKNFKDLVSAGRLEQIETIQQEVTGGQAEAFFTTELISDRGMEIAVECHARRIRYKDRDVVLNVVRDISERVHAAKALHESQQTLLTIMDSIYATIYVADLDTHEILFMNKHMKEVYGANLEGRKCYGVIRQLSMPCPSCTIKTLLEKDCDSERKITWEGLNPVTNIWYINYDRIITWIDGRQVKLQISFDITQMKELEQERARTEQKLRRSQKMEAIGTLAGGVAHDLNNILTGIVSYPDLLLMELPDDSPLRRPVKTIRETGLKAAAIVQDLLTLARRSVVRNDVVDLNTIVCDYLDTPEHQRLKRDYMNITFRFDQQPDLFCILGSTVHLEKTLMNLVVNAAEAIEGSGSVLITTRSRKIRKNSTPLADMKEGEYVVLSVSDDGCGISPDDSERIFEPFFTNKVMGRSGTGLGMAVIWGTVEDHEGYIDFESTPGKGTTFNLYFPVTRKELLKEQLSRAREDFKGRGERILVVDDMKEQREIASMMFSQLGYNVVAVGSGEEAVAFMRDNSVDLLLLDMIMAGGINGLETYRRILRIHPGQKAIVASGYSETEHVKEAIRLGAGRYIRKPYLFEDIASAVKEELRREVPVA